MSQEHAPYSPPQSDLEHVENAPEKRKKLSIIWIILSSLFVIGIYGSLFIPASQGITPQTESITSSALLHSIFLALIWRRTGRKGLNGGIYGAVIGLAVYALAVVLSGAAR